MYVACKKGRLNTVEILHKAGANLNKKDVNILTPLHIASINGHTSIVKYLIKNGAKIDE